MDTLSRKIELYETINGKTSGYLKAWSKVLLIIFVILSGIGAVSSIPEMAIHLSNPLSFISYLFSLASLGFLIAGLVNSKKANKNSYISNIGYAVIYSISSLLGVLQVAFFDLTEYIPDSDLEILDEAGIGSEVVGVIQSFTVGVTIFSFVVTLVLAILHIVYMIKRKDLFLKTVEELEEQAGVSSDDDNQYVPYISPEG